MAVYQLIFREHWPLGQEIRRPGEIVLEGECRISNATPEKIANAIRFHAIEIRELPCSVPEKAEPEFQGEAAPEAPAATRRRKLK